MNQRLRSFGVLQIGIVFGLTGLNSFASAASPTAGYVPNSGDDTVSVIDLPSNTVTATIGVGDNPSHIAITPDGQKAYVTNRGSNTVSVIKTSSGSVIQTIPVGTIPIRLTASPDGQRVYVANSGSASVSVIDVNTDAVVSTISTPPNPNALAFHPVRDELWIGFNAGGTVLQVRSASSHAVLAENNTFSRWYASGGLAFRPDGSEVIGVESCGLCGRFHRISGNYAGGMISVFQQDILFDNTGSAEAAAINPVSGVAYLAKQGQAGPHKVVELGGVGRTATFSGNPDALAVTPDGATLYVVHPTILGSVSVVDTQSFTVLATINVGTSPTDIALGASASPITQVTIDIKPGSDPNSINLGSNGVVPVAILSSTTFDATTVDPSTVTLAGAGVAVRGQASNLLASVADVNGDGLNDLDLKVETQNLDPGQFQNGTAILTGETFGGTPIEGSDSIVIVPE